MQENVSPTPGKIRGPKIPGFFQFARWLKDPMALLDDCAARYGPSFKLNFGLLKGKRFFFAEPSVAKAMFGSERDHFKKGGAKVFSAYVGKGSLLLMTGDEHRRERRLIDPLFHGKRMVSYGGQIRAHTDRAISNLPVGRPFAVYDTMQDITMSVIISCLFGVVEEKQFERLKGLLKRYLGMMSNPRNYYLVLAFSLLPVRLIGGLILGVIRLLTPRKRRIMAKMKAVKDEIYELVVEEIERYRKEGPDGREDVLAKLVEVRDENGEPKSEEEICGELLTFLIAGHSTTSISLTWTLAYILQNPAVEERLREELDSVFGKGEVSERGSELKYLDAIIKESLRLQPIFLTLGRSLGKDMNLAGHDLPAGSNVVLSTYLLHRRPDLWENPEEFRPERFLTGRPSPFEYCPFGGGPRICVGNAFAAFESRWVMARLFSRVSLRLAPGEEVRPQMWASPTPPANGLPLIVDEVKPVPKASAGAQPEESAPAAASA